MNKKRKLWLYLSIILIGGAALLTWRSFHHTRRTTALPVKTVRLGEIIEQEIPSTFVLPFIGTVTCAATIERVSVPCTDESVLQAELKVFYSPDGQPIRILFSKKKGFQQPPPSYDTEDALKTRAEKINGLGKLPLPRTWDTVFRHLSKHVDLREATYFDMTYVERQVLNDRRNVFLCRIFGARGLDGPSTDETENNVRIIYDPVLETLRFDTNL